MKAVLPFIALMFVCLGLVTYVPSVSLGLVSLSKGGDFWVSFPDQAAIAEEEATEAKEAAAEDEPANMETPDGVKSLEDLMNETEEDSDGAESDEGVKSLEDLMEEVDEEESDSDESGSVDEASSEEVETP